MNAPDKDDWKRIVSFQGSYFFSGRRVPGLEPESLPKELARNSDGDVIQCISVSHWKAPTLLQAAVSPTPAGDVALDSTRCGNCTATFASHQALLQHCRDASHQPVTAEDFSIAEPASQELFTAYCNIFLNRALEER